jgi:hypothetical protein
VNIIVSKSSDNSSSNNIIKSKDVIRRVDRNSGILSEVQVGSDKVVHNRVYDRDDHLNNIDKGDA